MTIHYSHQDFLFITDHLFNLLDASLPPLVSQDDPLHLLLPHLVYLPPHQPHHSHQVHTDQGLEKYAKILKYMINQSPSEICIKNDHNGGIWQSGILKSFQWRSSSIKCRLPNKVVFQTRSSSNNSLLPSKVVVHRWSSSIKGRLPSKVIFHRRLSQGAKWGMYLHTWVCIHTFSRNWVCKRYVFDQKGM